MRRGISPGGIALIMASAFCYATLGIFGKIAYSADVSLLSLLSARFTLAAGCFWILVLLSPRLRGAAVGLGRRRTLSLFAWGLLGYAGQSAIFFSALHEIPAGLAVVLLYTSPAFLALIVWVRTRRPPTAVQMIALGLVLSGTWLCAAPNWEGGSALGVGLSIFAGFWMACFVLGLARATSGIPSMLSGALMISGAAVSFGTVALLAGQAAFPSTRAGWGALLGMVTIGTLISFVLFIAGLKRVGAQVAVILNTFEPVGAVILAAIILGEQLLITQQLGAFLIVGAAFVLAALGGAQGGPFGSPVPTAGTTRRRAPVDAARPEAAPGPRH
ncbi:MAG: EamA family transporter [Acidobacteria bacterium]|nr:EamA family transporter [Acidobacteriota bacterium]